MRHPVWVVAALLLTGWGCGEASLDQEPVPLEKLPAGALVAAKKRLPGYTIERARKSTFGGKESYEIIAKNKRGKTKEVEVSATGEILEVE